tara:strand:+ start:4337 stop:4906 length:570 start_codon:yes stop_codon:yes gene_type:complete
MKKVLLFLLALGISQISIAQEGSNGQRSDTIHFHKAHQRSLAHEITGLYGSVIFPEFDENGKEEGYAFLPSVSLDYDMWFHKKVGFLIMNEFILNSFEVRDAQGETFERESIMINVVGIGYRPVKSLDFSVGVGIETDLVNSSSNTIFRLGAEYAIPIRKHWATVLAVSADFRKHYKSGAFEIGFARFM